MPDQTRWLAPTLTPDTTRRNLTLTLPGSKSLTNRYLVLAALAEGASVIEQPLDARDTRLMASGIERLGARVRWEPGANKLEVLPGQIRPAGTIDVGLAGTVMRFLPPVAALAEGSTVFDGDERSRLRPMRPLVQALNDLGVEVASADGFLPLMVSGRGSVAGGRVGLDASSSSQLVSALLLSGSAFDSGIEVHHVGRALPSAPHISMSLEAIRTFGGVARELDVGSWRVEPRRLIGCRVAVEPDMSNAAVYLAYALISGNEVRIRNWTLPTSQPGDLLRASFLPLLGAKVQMDGDTLCVRGTGAIPGFDVDLGAAGELAPTMAALGALAEGPVRLRGIAHLRGHETDRLAALVTEIKRMGGKAHELADGIEIEPSALHGATIQTYDDHRIATFAAIVGLRVPGVEVLNVETTSKTLPGFAVHWEQLVRDTNV